MDIIFLIFHLNPAVFFDTINIIKFLSVLCCPAGFSFIVTGIRSGGRFVSGLCMPSGCDDLGIINITEVNIYSRIRRDSRNQTLGGIQISATVTIGGLPDGIFVLCLVRSRDRITITCKPYIITCHLAPVKLVVIPVCIAVDHWMISGFFYLIAEGLCQICDL